jgi:hypothetical protein
MSARSSGRTASNIRILLPYMNRMRRKKNPLRVREEMWNMMKNSNKKNSKSLYRLANSYQRRTSKCLLMLQGIVASPACLPCKTP